MRSRGFNKRIAIYSTEPVSDGYGGYVAANTLVGISWAKIESISPGKAKNVIDFGVNDPQNSIQITVRKRKDLIYNSEYHYFSYAGLDYKIVSAPTDTNFEARFVTFIGTKISISQTTAAAADPPLTPSLGLTETAF